MSSLLLPSGPKIWNPRMPGGMRDGLLFLGSGEHPGGNYYHDSSGFDQHGNFVGIDAASSWKWSNTLSRSYTEQLEETDGRYIEASPRSAGAPELTFSLWGWWGDIGNFQAGLFTSQVDATPAGSIAAIKRDEVRFADAGGSARSTSFAQIPQYTWAHLSAVMKNGSQQFYVNGRLAGSSTRTYDGSIALSGLRWFVGYPARYHTGRVSDFLIHGRSLHLPEIQWLANPANHLRVPWRRKSWLVGGAVAATPLTLTGAALDLESPYAVDDAVATAAATGGTPGYTYTITSQVKA